MTAQAQPAAPVRRARSAGATARLLGLVILGVVFIAFVWPILSLMGASLQGGDSMAAYAKLATSPNYRRAFVNTFVIAGLVTGTALVAAYPLAYLMASVPPRVARMCSAPGNSSISGEPSVFDKPMA